VFPLGMICRPAATWEYREKKSDAGADASEGRVVELVVDKQPVRSFVLIFQIGAPVVDAWCGAAYCPGGPGGYAEWLQPGARHSRRKQCASVMGPVGSLALSLDRAVGVALIFAKKKPGFAWLPKTSTADDQWPAPQPSTGSDPLEDLDRFHRSKPQGFRPG